jgi:predicted RNA-binding protein with PIN domain
MATPYLIIDGYNLMHAAGIARRSYAHGDLARCRRRLNQLLVAHLDEDVLARATIVYDAFDSPSNANRHVQHAGLAVTFAPKGDDADSEIERLLNGHSAPRQVIVVSSDHRLHKAAKRRRARCVDSEEFLAAFETEATVRTPATPQKVARKAASSMDALPEECNSLQLWANEHEQETAQSQETDPAKEFETDYVKRLQDDVKKGRLK